MLSSFSFVQITVFVSLVARNNYVRVANLLNFPVAVAK